MIPALLVVTVIAFVPTLIYVGLLWWLDRHEKEPLGLLLTTFLWGAVPSIALALIMQVVLDIPLTVVRDVHQLTYELVGASFIAPLTEEAVKALGLLGLFLLWRRELDSPLDGLIYGGLVGFGFAAIENVSYFLGAYAQEGYHGVLWLALMRAGVFGLNHAMYTGFTGLGVALAVEWRSKVPAWIPVVAGFVLAVFAHALHNGLATVTSYTGPLFLLMTIAVDWVGIGFLLLVALGSLIWERHRLAAYLEKLAAEGLIAETERPVLESSFQRGVARLRALLGQGVRGWWRMWRYHQVLANGAFAWHRVQQGDQQARVRLERLEREMRELATTEG